jgi:hypothetical protein
MIKNKKAQISEGITWTVATIAIVIILVVSIFITSAYVSKNKGLTQDFFDYNFPQKSFLSYLLVKEDTGTVFSKIKENNNLDNFNGNLALSIFNPLYAKQFQQIWVGVSILGKGFAFSTLNGIDNGFFGKKPKLAASGPMGSTATKDAISSAIAFGKQNFTEAIFVKNG